MIGKNFEKNDRENLREKNDREKFWKKNDREKFWKKNDREKFEKNKKDTPDMTILDFFY